MIETLQDRHLAPHALLVSLDLLLNGIQTNLASDVLWCDLGRGISCGRKRDWGSRVRVEGGCDGRRGWAGVHCSGAEICDDHDVGYMIYLPYRRRDSRTYHTFSRPDEPVPSILWISQTEVAALPLGDDPFPYF
jgi:hypothetical protein